MPESRARLPAGVREPFEVYVNGVRQELGRDYRVQEGRLVFNRELVKEQRLGFWRWLRGAFGIGTYGRDDQVDVAWEIDGRPQLAHALDLEVGEPRRAAKPVHRHPPHRPDAPKSGG